MHRFLHSLVAIALVAFALPASAATLTVGVISRDGTSIAAPSSAAAGGDECQNDGRTVLRVLNNSGANAYTVTVAATRTVDGQAVDSKDITVAVSANLVAGPWPPDTFNQSNSRISWTYTGSAVATDLDVQCLRLPER